MAIALDTSTHATTGSNANSLTFAHTCTGSNLVLFVTAHCHDATSTTTGVTYNGATMTQIGTKVVPTNGSASTLWYLIAPTTGSHNVVITQNAIDTNIDGNAISYTGVQQSGIPDANSSGGPTTTTSYSQSVTTIADNCWAILIGVASSGLALTAGSNTTLRYQNTTVFGEYIADTNSAKTPAGTDTMNLTSASQEFTGLMASFPAFVTSYTMTVAPASFAYTAQTDGNYKIVNMVTSAASYAFTGLTALIGKVYPMAVQAVSYTLSGLLATFGIKIGWTNTSKDTSSFSDQTKNTSSFSNQTKDTSSYTNQPKL